MYVLDTNTLIYFFKGEGRVADRLLATPRTEVAFPSIVLFELETGIAKSAAPRKRRAQLDEAARSFEVLPFGAREARTAARLRARLESLGAPIGPYDLLIGATASSHGATLVTRNIREFSRIDGLPVESWFD